MSVHDEMYAAFRAARRQVGWGVPMLCVYANDVHDELEAHAQAQLHNACPPGIGIAPRANDTVFITDPRVPPGTFYFAADTPTPE